MAQVSGMPVERFIETRILEPLGMRDTHTGFKRDVPWANRVNSTYRRSADGYSWQKYWDNSRPQRYRFFMAAGGLYATTSDYAKFLAMWMDGGVDAGVRMLSEAAVKEALTPGSERPYGFNWYFPKPYGFENVFMFGHGGSDGTLAVAVPEHDVMLLYFTQSRGNDTLAQFLVNALRALIPRAQMRSAQ